MKYIVDDLLLKYIVEDLLLKYVVEDLLLKYVVEGLLVKKVSERSSNCTIIVCDPPHSMNSVQEVSSKESI